MLPEYLHDIFQRISIDENLNRDSGLTAVIDFQPDFRFPLVSIQTLIMKYYKHFTPKESSLITEPSLTAYCLALLYGLALLNDTAVLRTRQSSFATDFLSDAKRNELFIELSRAYVPPFLHSMFDSLQCCRFPSKDNIHVIYTLACAHFGIDFGRIIPCTVFTYAHNIIASNPTNIHPSQLMHLWLTSQITNK